MTKVISLSPTMTKRMGFDHPLMDEADSYRTEPHLCHGRDDLIMAHLWLVKDVVSRFRAHWPETRRFTDDLVSTGMEALTEFFDRGDDLDEQSMFNKLQKFMIGRMTDYVNDNRSAFSASTRTNYRRSKNEEPLEYNFTVGYADHLCGEDDYSPNYVDLLDEVERLAETDREHMYHLVMMALNKNHDIDEASLSEEEKAAIERLSEIGAGL